MAEGDNFGNLYTEELHQCLRREPFSGIWEKNDGAWNLGQDLPIQQNPKPGELAYTLVEFPIGYESVIELRICQSFGYQKTETPVE